MKIIRKIEFTGKNLNDVFALPCVVAIIKIEGQPLLSLDRRKSYGEYLANPGDTLVEYESGMWSIKPGRDGTTD